MLEVLTSTATIVNPEVTGLVSSLLTVGLKAALIGMTALLSWGVAVGVKSIKSTWKRAIAQRLVSYAQQRLTGDEEKRKYVAAQIHQQIPRISVEEADQLLEEAVVRLKVGLSEPAVISK